MQAGALQYLEPHGKWMRAHREEGHVLAQRVEHAPDGLAQLLAHDLEGVARAGVEDIAARAHVLAEADDADHIERLPLRAGMAGAHHPSAKTVLCR